MSILIGSETKVICQGITVPLVVRLEGTNVELGKKILAESGLKITPADDLGDAAEKITAAVKKAAQRKSARLNRLLDQSPA